MKTIFVTVFLVFVSFAGFSQVGVNGQKNIFKGYVTYEIETNYLGEVPPMFEQLNRTTTKTFIVRSKDTLLSVRTYLGDTLSITRTTLYDSKTYIYSSGKTLNFSSLMGKDSQVKRIRKKETKVVSGYESRLYKEKSVAGITFEWIAEDFPYQFPFDIESARILKFPLYDEGFKLASVWDTEVTKTLSSSVRWKLIEVQYCDNPKKVYFPDYYEEDYIPEEPITVEYKAIPVEFRQKISIDAYDITGVPFSTDSLQNEYYFIALWASYCEPCIRSIPFLGDLVDRYSSKGLQVMSISKDGEDNITGWKKLSKNHNIYWPNILSNLKDGLSVFDQLKIKSVPRYLILDKNGFILYDNAPAPSDPALFDILKRMLN